MERALKDPIACRVCGGETAAAGSKRGILTGRIFQLRRCAGCGFGFVSDPDEDYARIYDESYYRGEGPDPLVDYLFELEHPEATIRRWEWEGIVEVVRALRPVTPGVRWLDYGCGNGGLVRHLLESRTCEAVGFETGWIAERARARGIPVASAGELASHRGRYDVVSAIEVIEHVVEPLAMLRAARELLKPGGLLFLTTGNAARQANLARWNYVIPEIHVSFFEPRTLERALQRTGFQPQRRGFLPGFEKIIRFKILKNLGFRRDRPAFDVLPWARLARLADARLAISAHPVGWAA
jgi:SAM-dependent methyltransferase